MIAKRSSTSLGVNAAVGSSISSTRAFCERALAISTICCVAIDRPRTFVRVILVHTQRGQNLARFLAHG